MKKCQSGKKRDKFPWKNITYLVVLCVICHLVGFTSKQS
jgi:hypothetical protein